MRIATWNVNSLKARLEKVMWWLDRAKPDVLLMQETKLADADAPVGASARPATSSRTTARAAGTAWPSRAACGIGDVVTNFGEPLRPAATPEAGDDEPLAEARMIAAECGGVRVVCVYAPNGRQRRLAVLRGQARLVRAAGALARRGHRLRTTPLVIGGDFNVAPDGHRRVGPARLSWRDARLGARAARRSRGSASWGLVDAYRLHHPEPGRYTWWDYRAGNFHKNFGMRIDHLLVTPAARRPRVVWAEIDREARKGKPIPSDHAPLVIDLDSPGYPFDAGWASAASRIAARLQDK